MAASAASNSGGLGAMAVAWYRHEQLVDFERLIAENLSSLFQSLSQANQEII